MSDSHKQNAHVQLKSKQIIQTVCGICSGSCGINVTLENETIVKVEGRDDHPMSQGYVCPKGKAAVEMVEAPDRLKSPMKKISEDRWEEISWDEAIDMVAQQLERIKDKYGPEAVATHVGQAGVGKQFAPYAERFCNVFGTPNFSTPGSHCHISKEMAHVLTYGALPAADYESTNCIALWGYNPSISCPPLMRIIDKALKQGAKLIVVDPRETSLARRADLHLQLRPGTDGALALGMLYIVISENLYDKEFVDNWTIGFDKLVEHVKNYTPEEVEKITWVPAEKIRAAAHLYATTSPACSYQGIAVELQTNGVQSVRAIAILQAITGNLDITGGSKIIPEANLSPVVLGNNNNVKPPIGQNEFPLFCKHTGHSQSNIYPEAIIEGKPYPIKGMILSGTHPIVTWPNAGKIKKSLSSLEFLAVMDLFMTETAKLADLVLPAATFLERYDLWTHASYPGVPRLGIAQKALSKEECMADWDFWIKLASRMGFGKHFPWKTEEEAINFRLKPLGVTVEELKDNPKGYIYSEWMEKGYKKKGFKTPSGKVEIYSRELEKYGHDPLPAYEESSESPVSRPDLVKDYPLILSTGARMLGYQHSRFRNIPSLRKMAPEPLVEINSDKAKELQIEDGEVVIVESLRGSIKLKTKITNRIDPRVIFISHGWDEANANILTDNQELDPISGFPADRAFLVRIKKLNGI